MDEDSLVTLQAMLKGQYALLFAIVGTHPDPEALLKEFSLQIGRVIETCRDLPREHRFLVEFQNDMQAQLRRRTGSTSQSG